MAPWPWAPSRVGLAAGIALLVVLTGCVFASQVFRRTRYCAFLLGVSGALCWSGPALERHLERRVPAEFTADPIAIEVEIASDPVELAGAGRALSAWRFEVLLTGEPPGGLASGTRLRLSWYDGAPPTRGETWRLVVRLRQPWGPVNPGGSDLERWMFGKEFAGTGVVQRGVRLDMPVAGGARQLRAVLARFVDQASLNNAAIVQALLAGDAGGITSERWQLFRATGTVHLMVISGLHIGLAAGLGFFVGRFALAWLPLLLPLARLRLLAGGCGLMAASGYLLLSGVGLPAVRACLMAAPALLLVAWGRRSDPASAYLLALSGVLAVEPIAIHQMGFWLSFGAVGVLIVHFQGRLTNGKQNWILTLWRTQLLLSISLLPVTVLTTGAVPTASIPANLVAVPVVSLLVVPMLLIAAVLQLIWMPLGGCLLWLVDRLLDGLIAILEALSSLPALVAEPHSLNACVAILGSILLVPGSSRRDALVLLLGMTSVLVPRTVELAYGEFRVTGLDVGQGDAIVVDTARHRLLFDAGPGFPGGGEMGSRVVVPSLLASGPPRLDVMVLSHADLDHVGGASAVLAAMPGVRVISSFDYPGAMRCVDQSWQWDGVWFEFIDVPRPRVSADGPDRNDTSCLLLVGNGKRHALLAGDISARVEGRLLRGLVPSLDLLFAPHHGSRTSSSRAFIRVTAPRVVVISAGRDNRYGHPHPQVIERYTRMGATLATTWRLGALRWESTKPSELHGAREGTQPYWRAVCCQTLLTDSGGS